MSNSDKYTREKDKRFTLRIDKELFSLVEQSAKNNKRSIGREIEYALELYITSQNNNRKE